MTTKATLSNDSVAGVSRASLASTATAPQTALPTWDATPFTWDMPGLTWDMVTPFAIGVLSTIARAATGSAGFARIQTNSAASIPRASTTSQNKATMT